MRLSTVYLRRQIQNLPRNLYCSLPWRTVLSRGRRRRSLRGFWRKFLWSAVAFQWKLACILKKEERIKNVFWMNSAWNLRWSRFRKMRALWMEYPRMRPWSLMRNLRQFPLGQRRRWRRHMESRSSQPVMWRIQRAAQRWKSPLRKRRAFQKNRHIKNRTIPMCSMEGILMRSLRQLSRFRQRWVSLWFEERLLHLTQGRSAGRRQF